jgi:hypothetical protein
MLSSSQWTLPPVTNVTGARRFFQCLLLRARLGCGRLLKADQSNRYRNKDDRWFTPKPEWFRDAMGFEKGYRYQWRPESEADLRVQLAEGGQNHKHVVPGGVWWKHTQYAIAEMEAKRVGDTKRLEEIAAERKADWEAFERELLAGSP